MVQSNSPFLYSKVRLPFKTISMKRIIKSTPITIDGAERTEFLIDDDTVLLWDACENCCYQDWYDNSSCNASCADVHGCGYTHTTYFEIF